MDCKFWDALVDRIADKVVERLEAITPSNSPPQLLDKRALGDLLSCSIATIDRLLGEGLPYVQLTAGQKGGKRFRADQVLAWIDSRESRKASNVALGEVRCLSRIS